LPSLGSLPDEWAPMPIKHLRSPALVSALVFAAGGAGFAIGSLLLARVLPTEEFGAVSLFLAVTQLGITLGPVGLSTLVNRHRLQASAPLLVRAISTSMVVALALAAGVCLLYDMSVELALILAATVPAAAVSHVGAAFFQSRGRFGISLFLLLVHNWVVLLAVPVVLLTGSSSALPAVLTIAAGYVATAVGGWWYGMRELPSRQPQWSGEMMREGLASVGAQLALSVMFQLDRLLIPRALSLSELATYSVVSAIAASPYRMLQVGASYTLLPRLRSANTRATILSLLKREALIVLSMALLATAVVLTLTPWVITEFLGGRYTLQQSLLYAMVLVGFIRVANGFATSAVMALGSSRQLAWLNGWSWIALLVGGAFAFAAADAGLTGIVYGIGAGWLTLGVAAAILAGRAIASRPGSGVPR
jgi:O-antigen/teichoic acid export membrane protein